MFFKRDTPGPGSYNIFRCRAVMGRTAPAYTFGIKTRDPSEANANPSPAHYSPDRASQYINPSVKDIRFKHKITSKLESRSPGPAHYNPEPPKTASQFRFSTEPRGCLRAQDNHNPAPNTYCVTPGYAATEVSPQRDIVFRWQERFRDVGDNQVPGPGKYTPDVGLRALGADTGGFHFPKDSRFKRRRFENTAFGYTIMGDAERIVRRSRYHRPYAK